MYTSVFSLFQNPVLHSLKSEGATNPVESSGKVSRNSCHSFQHDQDFVFYGYYLKTTALHRSVGMKDHQASLENCSEISYNTRHRGKREASTSSRPDRERFPHELEPRAHKLQHLPKPNLDLWHHCLSVYCHVAPC